MLTISTRAMSADERAIVERWAAAGKPRSPIGWVLFWVLGMPALSLIAAALVRLVIIAISTITHPEKMPDLEHPGHDTWLAIVAVVAIALIVAIVRRLRRPHLSEAYARAMTAALETGQVEALTCAVTDAAIIEQGGADQPALFILDVGDGKLLVVPGMDVLGLVMEGRFPNTQFTIVRLPGREDIITAVADGEYIKPSRTRGPLTAAEQYPGACAVLNGSLAELDAVLRAPGQPETVN